MIDFLFRIGLSNAILALLLALIAITVGTKGKRPHIAHMLWVLVFIKLVTPPLVAIPVPALAMIGPNASDAVTVDAASADGVENGSAEEALLTDLDSSTSQFLWFSLIKPWLMVIWLAGSLVVFAGSLIRAFQFDMKLRAQMQHAPPEFRHAAAQIARRLQLKKLPKICTTSARISPMVWWLGGPVLVVIPQTLVQSMHPAQWQWVLAHELAHVRRRDYMIRWLEWLACVLFWWNPVTWWAQRNLRATEEICCDALVLSRLKAPRRSYANSILNAVESLARPAIRPPAMASEVNSGGFLERRFKMIVSNTPNPVNSWWRRALVLICAVVVLPVGFSQAQDIKAVAKRLKEAVGEGELTKHQAATMLKALKKMEDESPNTASRLKMDPREQFAKRKMKKEDIKKKRHALNKAAEKEGKKFATRAPDESSMHSIGKKLKASVEAGEITKEEAAKKWSELKRKASQKLNKTKRANELSRERLNSISKKLKSAVKAGKMSPEEANAKLKSLKSELMKSHSTTKDDFRRKTKSGISSETSPEQARHRLNERQKKMIEMRSRKSKKKTGRKDGSKMAEKDFTKLEPSEFQDWLKKSAAQRQKKVKQKPTSRESYDSFLSNVKEAVKEGEMTEKEARKKVENFKKEMAKKMKAKRR